MSFFDAMTNDDITLHGLEKWTIHMYEQLGWITLANESGREDKVAVYITSINKLKKSIQSRLKIITSEDARIDLVNLMSKVEHLIKITSKLFNKEQIKKTICNKCSLPIEQNGGSKTKNLKSSKSMLSKTAHLLELSKLGKKTSKKSSKKKMSKKLSKKTSKKKN